MADSCQSLLMLVLLADNIVVAVAVAFEDNQACLSSLHDGNCCHRKYDFYQCPWIAALVRMVMMVPTI